MPEELSRIVSRTKISQGHNFTKFWGVSEVALRDVSVCDVFFSSSSSPMVLCPVNCPAEVHFTTIFAPRNGKIFEVEGVGMTHPYTPLECRLWIQFTI